MFSTGNEIIMNTKTKITLSTLAAALLAMTVENHASASTNPFDGGIRPASGQWLSAVPGGFIPNVGQAPDAALKFVLRDRGVSAYFTGHGFALWNGHTTTTLLDGRAVRSPVAPRWQLVGAKSVEPVGGETFPHTVSFFRGNDPAKWRANVPAYRDLRYREVLQGVDLRVESREHGFEYTFHVEPHAKPELRFRYDGITGLEKSLTGDLIVRTATGHFTESRPVSFQFINDVKHEVASSFDLISSNEYRIVVGSYDERHELVIDPVLDWSTFLGGSQSDLIRDVKVGPDGHLVVIGDTLSTDLPDGGAGFSTGPVAAEDAFVAKVTADGTQLIWLGYLAGSMSDIPGFKGLALDGAGHVYVAGRTESPNFPVTTGAVLAGASDVFVSKIASDGSALLFSTLLGGANHDWGWGIALDAAANVLLTGFTLSADFPALNAFDATFGGARDVFVTKLNPAGAVLWSSFLGGADEERPAAIRAAANGDVVIFGDTSSSDFPVTAGAFDTTLGGANDAFVTRIQSDGSQILWSTFLGGSANENDLATQAGAWFLSWGRGDMQVDNAGNILVGGQTFSADFPVTLGAFDTALAGTSDAYIAKLAPTGSLLWASYLGGSGSGASGVREEIAWGITVNPWDEIFVVGRTDAASFPVTSAAFQTSYRGGAQDGFLTQLSADGAALLYSSFLGGAYDEVALGAHYDSGNLFVAGWSLSGDYPITAGAGHTGCVSCPNNADGYVMKFLDAFIAHDGFESGNYSGGIGWSGNWAASGDVSILTSSGPHSGSRHVRLRRGTGLLSRTANVSTGSTTLKLGFWSKVHSFEGAEHANVRVSANGGSLTTVLTLASAQGDNVYHYYEIDLTSFLPATQIQIAFDAAMSASNDQWYLDDIRLTGTSEPVPPVANAGVDQTVTDTDNSGMEDVTLNGSASFDPDGGGIVSYEWKEGATVLGATASINPSLPVGVHTITLTVTDDEGATASDDVQITVNAPPPPPANPLHSGDLDGSSANSGKNWKATVVITMHDGNHAPVANATVSIQWSGGASGSSSPVTDANGRCTVISGNISKQSLSATLTITSVTHATLTYSAAANHDPDGDSNGTSITVNKP
jgi:hypothetical protein